jgi:hypothetical protein
MREPMYCLVEQPCTLKYNRDILVMLSAMAALRSSIFVPGFSAGKIHRRVEKPFEE